MIAVDAGLATLRWPLWGGEAHLLVTDAAALPRAAQAVHECLDAVERAASRFRPDSELSRLNAATGPVRVSPLFADLLAAAVTAAARTHGAVDPTVGAILVGLGYDRDFADLPADADPVTASAVPGWRCIRVGADGRRVELPAGVALDLGATAKARAADLAAAAATAVAGCGVLVNLAGDLAVAGPAPEPQGWVVHITDDHRDTDGPGPNVAIHAGGLATSSTTVRTWVRGGERLHHIVDPATGLPVVSRWRTVSVTAPTCVEANTAATAAIVFGDRAPQWLAERDLPGRLVDRDGRVTTVANWPVEAAP